MKRSTRLPWYSIVIGVVGGVLLLVTVVAVSVAIGAVVASKGGNVRSPDAVAVNQCHDEPAFTKAGQPESCDSDLGGAECCFKCCTPFVSAHTCLGQTSGVVNFQSGLTCPICAASHGGCAQRGARSPICLNGYCDQTDSISPSCGRDGTAHTDGGCKQIDSYGNVACDGGNCDQTNAAGTVTCDGGNCNQRGATGTTCNGGGCTQ